MKALFIGGTGTISAAITRLVASMDEWELYLVNRGNRKNQIPQNVKVITSDVQDERDLEEKLSGLSFDCVCDFIAFSPKELERDYRLFKGRTRQFIFISSASAYKKPTNSYLINESTPLVNPYWEYSRQKAAGERYLMNLLREEGFPVTIVRPSHTYDERKVPLGVYGERGTYSVIKRMIECKPVIIQGDGTSLWVLTHNSDFAKGFVGLMGNVHAIGEAYHITTDEVLTWNQIYMTLASILNVSFKPYYVASSFLDAVGKYDFLGGLLGDKANSVVFDNTKIKRTVPGFACTIRFEVGIRRTIEHILSHKECQIEDPEFDAWCDRVIETLEAAKRQMIQ